MFSSPLNPFAHSTAKILNKLSQVIDAMPTQDIEEPKPAVLRKSKQPHAEVVVEKAKATLARHHE